MSNSLPVPSKGALRALRNLALGTSCTVAVSAGLLTEDRRRRIHAARAVQQNGQRIKCSKSYHESAGAVAIAALEEHVLSPEYFTSTEERHILPPPGTWKSQPIQTHFAHEIPTAPGHAALSPPNIILKESFPAPVLDNNRAIRLGVPYNRSAEDTAKVAGSLMAKGQFEGLLRSINVILYHLRKVGFTQNDVSLLEVCGRIYERCAQYSSIQSYLPLLQELLRIGPVSEELYYGLHAPDTALQLLSLRARQTDTTRDSEYLTAAISIFLTPFEASKSNRGMRELERALCAATYNAQMWEETVKVCARIMEVPKSNSPQCIAYLILAHHALGNDREVIKHFRSDLAAYQPPKELFVQVVAAALDSALKQRRLRIPEEVVIISAEMARAGGFKVRAEWFNKVLGKQWRYSKDLAKTKAMFERLEAFVEVVDLPESFYCAMMQFCIEAGDEKLAYRYLDKQVSSTGGVAPLVQIRTSGHLALASATRGDWVAVKERIKALLSDAKNSAERQIISEVFSPLFKLYANRHDVKQTEIFLREFLEDGLRLHRYASNIMVDKFAGAMDMDSITRWLEEVPHLGLSRPDSATFNSILTGFRDDWGMPFEDLFKCVQEMKTRNASMVDDITFNIMRDALIRESRGNRLVFARSLKRLESLGIRGKGENGPENDLKIMREVTAKGSNVKALRHYEYAMADENSHISPAMLGLAIKACLNMRSDNCHEAAIQMLEDAKRRGVDITLGVTRLVLWEIDEANWDKRQIKHAVRRSMNALTKHGFEMPMSAILHIGNILCDRDAYKQALEVWDQYVKQSGIERQAVDISCLTLLLRIHLVLRRPSELEWIMQTISMNKIIPDKSFMVKLKNGKRRLKRSIYEAGIRSASTSKDQEYLEVLQALYKRLTAQREAQLKKSHAAAAQLLDIMHEAVKDEESGKQEVGKVEEVVQPASSVECPRSVKNEESGQQEVEMVEEVAANSLECPKCHEEKPRADFAKKNARLGLFDNCRGCRTEVTEAAKNRLSRKAEPATAPSPREDNARKEQVESRPQISIITREKNTPEQIEAHKRQVRKRWLDTIEQAREELEDEPEEKVDYI